jgi:hypothetical protein
MDDQSDRRDSFLTGAGPHDSEALAHDVGKHLKSHGCTLSLDIVAMLVRRYRDREDLITEMVAILKKHMSGWDELEESMPDFTPLLQETTDLLVKATIHG